MGHGYLATRWRPDLPPGALLEGKECYNSAVCSPILLILWWMVRVGHGHQVPPRSATRWHSWRAKRVGRADQVALPKGKEGCVSAWLILRPQGGAAWPSL